MYTKDSLRKTGPKNKKRKKKKLVKRIKE